MSKSNNDEPESSALDQVALAQVEEEGEAGQRTETMNESRNRDVRALLIQQTGMAPRGTYTHAHKHTQTSRLEYQMNIIGIHQVVL